MGFDVTKTLGLRVDGTQAIQTLRDFESQATKAGTAGEQSASKIAKGSTQYRELQKEIERSTRLLAQMTAVADKHDRASVEGLQRLIQEQKAWAMSVGASGEQMLKLEAIQNRFEKATGTSEAGIKKLASGFERLATEAVGVNPVIGRMTAGLAELGIGAGLTTGILAGIAAIGFAYEKLTESSRKAREKSDELTKSLLSQADAQFKSTLAGQADVAVRARQEVIDAKAAVDRAQAGASGAFGITGIIEGYAAGTSVATRYADAVTAAAIAEKNLRDAQKGEGFDVNGLLQSRAKAIKEQYDKEIAAAKDASAEKKKAIKEYYDELAKNMEFAAKEEAKNYEKEVKDLLETIRLLDKEKQERTHQLGLDLDPNEIKNTAKQAADDIDKSFKDAAERQKQVTENLIRSMQAAFSDFFVGLFNGGMDSFKKLFDSVRQLYLKMIADVLAAKVVIRIFGDKSVGSQQIIAGNIMQTASMNMLAAAYIMAGKTPPAGGGGAPAPGGASTNPYLAGASIALASGGIGYGIGRASGDRAIGAFGGAAAGALSGAAIGSIIPGFGTAVGAVVGGLAGLAGGLFGASSAAAEAAKQLKAMQLALADNIRALQIQAKGGPSLDDQISQIKRDDDKLRDSAFAVFQKDNKGSYADQAKRYQEALAKIAAAEDEYIARLKEEARVKNQQFKEDLEVRLLRAQGRDKEADQLALQHQQARERDALDEQIRLGLADEATKALLLQVQAAELLKKSVNELTRSTSNLVQGYKYQAAIFQHANPRPFGPEGPPMPAIPYSPTAPTGGIPGKETGDLTVNLVLQDGSVLATTVLKSFKGKAQKQFGDSTKWNSIQ
jgi:hypothetical protein